MRRRSRKKPVGKAGPMSGALSTLMRAKENEMPDVKCNQCGEIASSFIRDGSMVIADLCDDHNRALTRANRRSRGRILESIRMQRDGDWPCKVHGVDVFRCKHEVCKPR